LTNVKILLYWGIEFKKEVILMICNQPDCGYVFPKGMQVGDTCPGCGKSPFATKDETGQPITYTKAFLEGKEKILRLRSTAK
jgi:hypothetical protein